MYYMYINDHGIKRTAKLLTLIARYLNVLIINKSNKHTSD